MSNANVIYDNTFIKELANKFLQDALEMCVDMCDNGYGEVTDIDDTMVRDNALDFASDMLNDFRLSVLEQIQEAKLTVKHTRKIVVERTELEIE